MTALTQIAAAASQEIPLNENFETLSGLAIYGKRQAATTGLTWGYYGGIWAGTSISNGTVSLTDGAANYLVVATATGVLSVATSTTNWNDATNYRRIYKVTTASGAVTAVEDHRVGGNGLFR